MGSPVFEYHQSVAWAGWKVLGWAIGIMLGSLVVAAIFWASSPAWAATWLAIAWGISIFAIFGFAISNIRNKGQFSFIITTEKIECCSPSKKFGPTYSILVDDIAAIRREKNPGDGPPSHYFYLVKMDGVVLRVPTNYNNPANKIVTVLKTLKPTLRILNETGDVVDLG